MKVPDIPKTYKKSYSNLAGIDLANIPPMVSPSHSPDCRNVYKDYTSSAGQAVETRPGYTTVCEQENTIYGIHRLGDDVLIHAGTTVKKWTGFPSSDTTANISGTYEIAAAKSVSFVFGGKLYILDGTHYLVYDGTLSRVVGYIPTTRINADPDGGNGETFQGVNMLSQYRKNTFIGDGTSTTFHLDANGSEFTATVSGSATTISSYTSDTVTLASAPSQDAEVIITFKASVTDKVSKCTVARVFDNRVFLAGNPDYKGVLFHSELDDATYFRDDIFYADGNDDVEIKSLVTSSNSLIVIKDDEGTQTTKIFYHTPSLDYDLGKVYPVTETGINLGALTEGINFYDDIVYLTSKGLDSINNGLTHRSTYIDRKLVNDPHVKNSAMTVWNGYLVILCSDEIYLADSRQLNNGLYEWYIWNGIKPNSKGLYEHDGTLFYYTNNSICKFGGTNDDGDAIVSYWTTPRDVFGAPAYLKTVTKRGACAWVKGVQNSKIKISCITDKGEDFLAEYATSGFDFTNLDFSNFSFGTSEDNLVYFTIKKKKVKYFSLKFYSDILDKPFALFGADLEYQIVAQAKK